MGKRGNGEGSIYYSENLKRWVGQFTAGYKENGKLNRKTVYGKTRKEVANKINEKQNELNNNTFVDKSDVKFYELAQKYIDDRYNSNVITATTYLSNSYALNRLKQTNIYSAKIQHITADFINKELVKLKKYSASVIEKEKSIISNTLDLAVLNKLIYNNPFSIKKSIIIPKSDVQTREVDALTVDEQKMLVKELGIKDYRYKEIILIALYSGMRIGEILALEDTDIDLKNNIIHVSRTLTKSKNQKIVVGTKTKTYSGKRDVPLFPQIKCYFENIPQGLIFTYNSKVILPVTINSALKRICKNAGIRLSKYPLHRDNKMIQLNTSTVHTHMLRHTFATRCIEAGMQAVVLQKILGHKDISVTLNTYTSIFNKFKQNEVEKVTNYLDTF